MNTYRRLYIGTFLAAVGRLACATDPNLLPNGDFNDANQITNWTINGGGTGTLSWVNDDADGNATSGSLQLNTNSNGSQMAAGSACFDLAPNAPYSQGGQSRVVSGPSGQVGVTFSCPYFFKKACASPPAGVDIEPSPTMSAGTSWATPVSVAGIVPNTALSAYCVITITPTVGVPASVRFDNLFFNSAAPSTPVRLQSFDVR